MFDIDTPFRLDKTKQLHFVGIGGIGMSGIAELLLRYGYKITGSDVRNTCVTKRLEQLGAHITYRHRAENIANADIVIHSSAIKDDNIEIVTAKKHGIPVIRRAEMLYELTRMKYSITVAGTHGKTTSTSMVGMILTEADIKPTLIIGGVVKNFNSTTVPGDSDYIVVEADEYDRSFLVLSPVIAGITNIEPEHMDCYPTLDDLEDAFLQYANKVPFFGLIVACLDDMNVQKLLPKFTKRVCTYGLNPDAKVRAEHITFQDFTTKYNFIYKDEMLGDIHLQLPGMHNVRNSLFAAAVALELEIPFEKIRSGLAKFSGVYRRFERKGFIDDILVYDDYAHHPTEIAATLEGIRNDCDRRIIAVFQPHLYSRTQRFYREFADALSIADLFIVTDVYPAREIPIPDVTGQLVINTAIDKGNLNCLYVEDKMEIPETLMQIAKPGDIVITMGAGDIYKVGEKFIELLKQGKTEHTKSLNTK
jgi:UDP-N-acetylmuramate--alanine ligase